MDERTADLFEALRHPGAAFLLELLDADATESHLVGGVKRTTQATANRRLAALERAGVVARSAGRTKAPGRLWTLVHPGETDELLRAALALSEVTAERDRVQHEETNRALKRSRAKRRGLREAGNDSR